MLANHPHILVVDDDVEIGFLLGELLDKLEYKVTNVQRSPDALELIKDKKNDFDLVISDLSMPTMSGIQLANHIKEINKALPVIIMTGYSERVSQAKLKEMNVEDIMGKPITLKLLANTIKKVLSVPNKSN
ncbi:MAG: response regulator [Caldithrix sp.]|nr:response regulator [Caldithrix sp.]